MAKIFENERGFKVIEMSAPELMRIGGGIGGECICDHCGTGYDARRAIIIPPQWSCLDIADSSNLKMKIKMNKEKLFFVLSAIGFYGMLICPVMIVVLIVAAWGLRKYGRQDEEII